MIVSALLTSVGINLGLCILLFVLYSVLRKQPSNAKVYAPRLLAEGRAQQRSRFNIENLLPTAGWVRRAWQPSEDDLLDSCGLDAVVFMRIIIFSLRVFSVAGVIGIFVLLPVNYLGGQLSDIDFSDLPNKSLDLFSISNVKDGSSWLWVHFSAAYIISGVVCYLLYYEYKYISSKRVAYFITSKPQPCQFTILVRAIPLHSGTTISETVQRFFTEYYPSTYFCHVAVRRTTKLRGLILLNVYLPKYETGGRFWPIVHNSTIFALVLMQAILIGMFVLKKLPLASSLVLPLPVLTLLFNEYCRKRFLPIFNEYSAETLIKKDREDQNNPNVDEFYRKLVDAYRDPALMPSSHTVNINEHTAPLLSSIED